MPSFHALSKLHLSVSPRFRKHKDADEYQLLPPSSPDASSAGSQSPSPSPRFPIKLCFTPQSNRKRIKEDTCDPSTQAVMSLKPVEKVTSPYGFCTRTSSPNVRRESLFHRRRGKESCQSPVFSSASPQLRDSTVSNITNQQDEPSPDRCCSAQKSERKRLKVLYNKTQTALKSLTPRNKKTHVEKVQDVL